MARCVGRVAHFARVGLVVGVERFGALYDDARVLGSVRSWLVPSNRIPLSVTEKTAAGVSATYAYQVDAMGSVIGMTDASGAVVARYAYDPWGNPISATGTAAIATRNPLRYRAYYTDAETGLIYMPARYYDPATARFLSPDPAPPSAGDPGSLNAFVYCGNDPIGAIDPGGARAEAGGGGGFDQYKVKSGDLAWTLIGGGWSKSRAYDFLNMLRRSAAHLRWRQEQAVKARRYAQSKGARDAIDAAFWKEWHEEKRKDAVRSSWGLTDSQDDPVGYGLDVAGVTCDLLTVATGGTGIGAGIFGVAGATIGAYQFGRALHRYNEGEASRGDVAMAFIGIVPMLGAVEDLAPLAKTAKFIGGVDFVNDSATLYLH